MDAPPKPRVRDLFDAKSLAFAGFLSAGYFKSDPRLAWLPVDLTVLLAIASAAAGFAALVRARLRVDRSIFTILMLFLLFLIPELWRILSSGILSSGDIYQEEKSLRLFTVTLASALGPFVFIRDKASFRRFLNALAFLGFVQALDAISVLWSGPSMERLSGFGQNAIALGRSVGVATVVAIVLAVRKELSAIVALGLVLTTAAALLASGSRGPLLAVVVSVLVAGFHSDRRNIGKTLAGIGFLGAILGGMTLLLDAVTPVSIQRLWAVFEGAFGGQGSSEMARLQNYEFALGQILRHPFGTGWATFAPEMGGYPHNLVLEATLEAGWISGALLIGVIALSLKRVSRLKGSREGHLLLALLTYFLLNAMVSGDINHNKFVFVFMAVALSRAMDEPERPESASTLLNPSSAAITSC